MKTVIFLGPSLSVQEARETLDAVYLPPAEQTDFLTATVNHKPDVIGLVDGMFSQSLSVWHKEILYALDQGIRVYGASSMGALRAAETSTYGMIGVGEIYRQFASGELQDDDEVALSHAPADQGYRKVSEPMVNIRATLIAAELAGVIDAAGRAQLTAIGKRIYFAERSFPAIWREAANEGFNQSTLDALSRFVSASYVDQKKQDALLLLRTIRDLPLAPPNPEAHRKTFTFNRSSFFDTLYNRDRRVIQEGMALPQETISNYVALHDPDFDELNFGAMNRVIVFAFTEILGVEATEAEIDAECARFQKRRALLEEGALTSWLEKNHLSPREFREMMTERAHCRALHRWFLFALWMDRTTKVVLDELKLKDRYTEWAARAAAQESLLEIDGVLDDRDGAARAPLAELVAEHQQWTECRVDISPAAWAQEAGFHTEGNFRAELSRSRTARRALMQLLVPAMTKQAGSQEESKPTAPRWDGEGSASRPS